MFIHYRADKSHSEQQRRRTRYRDRHTKSLRFDLDFARETSIVCVWFDRINCYRLQIFVWFMWIAMEQQNRF